MSQNVNSQSVLESPILDDPTCSDAERATHAMVDETIDGLPMEAYAKALLDEVFEDIEHLLDGGVTYQPEPDLESDTVIAATPVSFTLSTPIAERETSQFSIEAPRDSAISRMISLLKPKPESYPTSEGQSVDRLLLVIGSLAAIVTLGTWFLHYPLFRKAVPIATNSPEVAMAPVMADPQFANYLAQALKNLDQRNQPASSPTTSNPVAAGLSPARVPPNPKIMPTVTVPSTTTPVPLPSPTVAASQPQQVFPFPLPQLPTSVPAVIPLPKLPFNPVQRLMQPNQTALQPGLTPALPGVSQTLVGVLDLGKNDRSAALVEISGVTQRFRVGENIGKGGWTLVEVSKNQVTIRRNGEVRTVFVGQSF